MNALKNVVELPFFHTKIRSDKVGIFEMGIGYLIGPFLAMMANSIFGAYLTRYYADVLGWTKFASGLFSALLPIVSVVFVIAGNLLIGQWIDQTNTTAGKARPYLLLSIPLLAVAIISMFTSPNNGSGLQVIWIAISYNLYYAMAYPCYYTAHSSMVSLSTRDTEKRGLLATLSNASMVAAAGVGASILVPVLLQSYMFVYNGDSLDIEASYAHWRLIALALMIVTALGALLEYFFTRERITEESAGTSEKTEAVPTSTHINACTHDKYWWMVMLFVLVFQTGQLVKNTSMSFYVRWMFESVLSSNDPESASGALMSVLGLIGGLPSAVGMLIAWPLANKIGKQKAIILGMVISLAGGVVAFFDVHNFTTVCIGVVLKAVGIIPAQYVILAMISDVLDHLEAKHGFRSDGFTMSIYSSIMVGLLGLAIGIVSGLLGAAGYDAALPKQGQGAEGILVLVYLAMDMISFVLTILFLFRMDVEKYSEEDQRIIRERNRG